MTDKLGKLKDNLSSMENALVAYSGGVDSTLLLKIAQDVLGDKAVGLIVISPTLPARELKEARDIALTQGFKLVEKNSQEMELPDFTSNSERRCYFCKDHLYKLLHKYAEQHGFQVLLDGSNADDLGDYRPGLQAALEQSVLSPLQEAGFTKDEIRQLAKELNLPNWDKPSSPCLSSRIPYGTEITFSLLQQVEKAEDFLSVLGFNEFRVRHHGDIARIEIPPQDFNNLIKHRLEIIQNFKDLGYRYVTLDIKGFRSGSLNEGLIDNG
jgi:uncharacterized protein